jgi:hypothetical protein
MYDSLRISLLHLDGVKYAGITPQNVRARVCDELDRYAHTDRGSWEVEDDARRVGLTREQYIRSMRRDGVWGTSTCLSAAAHHFKIRISSFNVCGFGSSIPNTYTPGYPQFKTNARKKGPSVKRFDTDLSEEDITALPEITIISVAASGCGKPDHYRPVLQLGRKVTADEAFQVWQKESLVKNVKEEYPVEQLPPH